MRAPATIGAAFFVAGFLAACASEQLSPEDRAPFCPVIVESKFERPAVHPNEFADPAGGPLRAMAGSAGASLMVGTFYAAPIGAIFGLGYGLACANAAASHPALARMGERVAVEVIAPRGLPDCRFRSTESGDVASK